ncbi:Slp family lipoprotein [Wohlfahrtiimonas larvae]|uniref:Lipoprotein n=1 Tax=Wohlfahrtiimonas larvae TaxID=1157986 RepID=A0ABP9MA31_9GAMM|nr:Slp family lipoprotein [Wohlfahrtiimonas larvae]
MTKLLKILPLTLLLTACASTFGDQAQNAITYQEALQSPSAALGKTIIVGGPIISYNQTANGTQIEIANAPLNDQDAPSIRGNMSERVIINIADHIPAEQLQNVRISAIGSITDMAEMTRYGNTKIIMITATQHRIWRTTKPMFDPNNKERYGYTYKVE